MDRLNESNAAAVVNGTYYGTLAEAVGAAQDGQTVTVLKDLATAPVTTTQASRSTWTAIPCGLSAIRLGLHMVSNSQQEPAW